ncbi:FHA domain-containing protein [Oleiagrimonas sp. C23AA]|uniref:FHA domain-containing protein n=1 Tax=Oleiagrimonas sp. C23AA TaxID=2719047 RepID=UPI0014239A72|nr:FHA domain-containing protein [Oleiagrimonas sp. C23AA]NII10367.1 forkhead-associated protein [Oleiagrimonas sp. C23AA]
MHIEFAHPSREPHVWREHLRIGSAADNDLVLREHGVAPHHLRVHDDARGLWLEVEPGAGRVYVNARPVRERALLRPGDCLGVGECRLWLVSERTEADLAEDAPEARPEAISLRAVAGPLSGRAWSVGEGFVLGEGGAQPLSLPDARAQGRVELGWRDNALWVSAEVPERYGLRVNGQGVREARLRNGDHLGVGAHRWVIDAWTMGRPIAEPEPVAAAPLHLPEDDAGPRGEVWWLIVTAAALGLIIALLVIIRI